MYKDRSREYYHTFSGERERERGKCRDVRGRIQVRAPNMKLKYVNPWPSFYITSAVELYFHLDGVDLKVRNVVIFFSL